MSIVSYLHQLFNAKTCQCYMDQRIIQTESYGFARQEPRCWSTTLILISCMSFLVDFRSKMGVRTLPDPHVRQRQRCWSAW